VFTPAREIFVVAEQVTALPPFSFRQVDDRTAEVTQTLANGFFGGWRRVAAPRNRIGIHCEAGPVGTRLTVTAVGDRAASRRATNLVRIVAAGERDPRTIYRFRAIPVGPCTLVQSWAGTGYPIFVAPDLAAARGAAVRPARPLWALEQRGHWVRVRVGGPAPAADAGPSGVDPAVAAETPGDGLATVGWVEADQLVPATDLTGSDGVSVSPMGADGVGAAAPPVPAAGAPTG